MRVAHLAFSQPCYVLIYVLSYTVRWLASVCALAYIVLFPSYIVLSVGFINSGVGAMIYYFNNISLLIHLIAAFSCAALQNCL